MLDMFLSDDREIHGVRKTLHEYDTGSGSVVK